TIIFNADQIDGVPEPERRPSPPESERHTAAEALLRASGARIEHRAIARTVYDRLHDTILLSERDRFHSPDEHYSSICYGLALWAGHSTRLGRDINHPSGSDEYIKEEILANIAAILVGNNLKIGYSAPAGCYDLSKAAMLIGSDPSFVLRAAR